MRLKTVLGLAAVSIFVGKGLYRLYQYDNNKADYNQSLANLGKDAIDAGNDLIGIFSDSQQEIDLCDNVAQISKNTIDFIAESET